MSKYFDYLKSKGGTISRFELLLMNSIVCVFGGAMVGNMLFGTPTSQILGSLFGLSVVLLEQKRRYSEFKKLNNQP